MLVFSRETQVYQHRLSQVPQLKSYSFVVGLPNSANTCYMNSLLQALSGCSHFMLYAVRLWNYLEVTDSSHDSYSVGILIHTLIELKLGSERAAECAEMLHEMMCQADEQSTSGVPFTSLFEQQDSHDLMFFLLDKITKVTSQFARKHKSIQGLNLSEELLYQKKQTTESAKDHKIDIRNRKGKGWTKANSLIGLNPFGAMTCSTVTCDECGPSFSSCNWQLEYALTVHLPHNMDYNTRKPLTL